MKRTIFTLLGLLMIISASAVQYEYDPLVREGKIWVECKKNELAHVEYLTYYQFQGKTTINGVDYHNLYATTNTRVISDEDIPTAFVREEDKKVYVIINGLAHGKDYQWGEDGDFVHIYGCQLVDSIIGEYVMYDFNNFLSPYGSLNRFTFLHIQRSLTSNQMQIGDHLANYFSCICEYAPLGSMYYSVAEGIGPLSKAFINIWNSDYNLGLAWVEDGGEVIYRGGFYNEAVDFLSYVPLVREGVKWVEYYKNTIEDTQSVTYYQFSGEEHVGSHDYSKLYATTTDTVSQVDTPVAYVREENKQVFIIPINVEVNGCKLADKSLNEYQIYDFNDITEPYLVEDYFIDPVNAEQVIIDNRLAKKYTLGGTKQIVEGIGCLDYVFFNPWHIELPDGSHSELAWVEANGEMIYRNDNCYEEAEAASGYVKLVREGVVWEYVGHYFEDENENIIHRPILYTLEFNGTTIITNNDGSTVEYHNLYYTDYDEQGNAQEPYLVAKVRENAKVVYAIDTNNYWWMVPDFVYNFTSLMFLPEKAIIKDSDFGDYYYWPYSTDRIKRIEVEVAGTLRKGYHINYNDGNNYYDSQEEVKIIEGIGVDCWFGDLLLPYRDFWTSINPVAGLSAVYENGGLVYKGFAYEEAQQLKELNAINTVTGDKQVTSVRYYNLAGVESPEPFDGMSIKVTTYSDGTRKCEKVVK